MSSKDSRLGEETALKGSRGEGAPVRFKAVETTGSRHKDTAREGGKIVTQVDVGGRQKPDSLGPFKSV